MTKEELKQGDRLFYLRCVPKCDIFEVVQGTVHNITDEYFTVVAQNNTQIFSYNARDIFWELSEAEGELESRKNQYYSSHKHSKEESIHIPVGDGYLV